MDVGGDAGGVWAGQEDFSAIFGGADSTPSRSVGPRTDLNATELEYYSGGGVPPLAPATPLMYGTTDKQVGGGSHADLTGASEGQESGVQWGGTQILQKVMQNVGNVVQTGLDQAAVVLSGVRRLSTPAQPAPAAPGGFASGVGGFSWLSLLLVGGIGYLAYRNL